MKHIVLALGIVAGGATVSAQMPDFSLPDSAKVTIDPMAFNYRVLEEVVLVKINEHRFYKQLGLLKEVMLLKSSAYDQSIYMAENNSLEQDNPGERAVLYGGTRAVSEAVARYQIKNGNAFCTYGEAGDKLLAQLTENPQSATILRDPLFTIAGTSTAVNSAGDKVYLAVDLGNENSIAPTIDKLQSANYISTKTFGLLPFNSKLCRKCEKIDHPEQLAASLTVTNGEVWLSGLDVKRLKAAIKGPDDGLAVDIVQRSQFTCENSNILNYSVPNKGFLIKPVYSDDLFEAKDSKGMIRIKMGEIPKTVKDTFELNLMVIIDKHVCKNIYKSYIETPTANYQYTNPLPFYADPKSPKDATLEYNKVTDADCRKLAYKLTSTYFQNKQNFFNSLQCEMVTGKIFTDAAFGQVPQRLEKLRVMQGMNADTLRLLEFDLMLRAAQTPALAAVIKADAITKLQNTQPFAMSVNNVCAVAQFFINQGDYRTALKWLDPIALSNDCPEDMLFSYVTLSSLYNERLSTSAFPNALKKAAERNKQRYCQLFAGQSFSFQLFENIIVKEAACKQCVAQ